MQRSTAKTDLCVKRKVQNITKRNYLTITVD